MTNHRSSDPAPRPLDTLLGPVAVTDEGPVEAPFIVCVHGLPGSSRDFRYLGPLLADHFRVVRIEMPGFGASPAGTVDSIAGWSRVIHATADALGLERFILLAHSFGGGAAILAAGARPARIAGLVLVSSTGARQHRALRRPPRFWARMGSLVAFPPTRPIATAMARRGYRARKLPFPSSWRDLRLQLRLTASIDFAAIGRAAAKVTAPTLIFQAQDDPLVESAIATDLAQKIPGASLHTFDTGGHHLQKTRAQDIATIVTHELLPQQDPAGVLEME
ncbi:MAG: alpha/beta hydrolase [Acidobacteria bacterium]|nr:alpha/beta hydrolase [Acidobacteriota bacterium]